MPDYSNIIKRSVEVVRKNKWLLVYGLILAAFASGGGGGGGNGGGSGAQLPGEFDKIKNNIPDIQNQTAQVLGAYTDRIADWLRSTPIYVWGLLLIAILIAIAISITVRMVLVSFAKGAMIAGIQNALAQKQVDLRNTAQFGIENIKSLIVLSVQILLLTLALIIVPAIIFFVILLVVQGIPALKTIWIALGVITGVTGYILYFTLLAMASIYAERLIVLQKIQPWQALKTSFSLSKKSFMANVLMGVINSIITGTLGCLAIILLLIITGVPAFLMLYPNIKNRQIPSVYEVVILIALIFTFLYMNLLVRAVIEVFKYANWNQMYEYVIQKTEGAEREENGK
jgi:hypothetical protein